ncbi:MAG: hypothetical protein M1426_04475 [Patescibacteria group bacterium]|nr:hypothetical protein [Patescibacteria group bacterium]
MSLFLHNGARIGIIGGGPAGSFAAIHFLTLAASLNKQFSVVIFDKKDFTIGAGCNFCAGILSNTLIKELSNYNIAIPSKVIQRDIQGYYYETVEGTAYFPKPPASSIYSVFRANGPCTSKELYNISFDYFLLQEAIKRGAQKIDRNVKKVVFSSNPQQSVILYSQECDAYYEFDLVIGACGVNSPFTYELEKSGVGYKTPLKLHSGQAEIPFESGMDEKLLNNVIIFLIPYRDIYFFSITPKEKYFTFTAIGPHVTKKMIEELFTLPQVKKYFPKNWHFPFLYCHCHPQLPVSVAQNPFFNRFVVVGDACWSRYLKDGITSAFYTAKLGAESAINNGVSRDAFKNHYSKKIRDMDKDNTLGKLLFKLHNNFQRSPSIRNSLFSMAVDDSHQEIQEKTRFILWALFTGDYPYKKIMKTIFNISFILHFIGIIILNYSNHIVRKLIKSEK